MFASLKFCLYIELRRTGERGDSRRPRPTGPFSIRHSHVRTSVRSITHQKEKKKKKTIRPSDTNPYHTGHDVHNIDNERRNHWRGKDKRNGEREREERHRMDAPCVKELSPSHSPSGITNKPPFNAGWNARGFWFGYHDDNLLSPTHKHTLTITCCTHVCVTSVNNKNNIKTKQINKNEQSKETKDMLLSKKKSPLSKEKQAELSLFHSLFLSFFLPAFFFLFSRSSLSFWLDGRLLRERKQTRGYHAKNIC